MLHKTLGLVIFLEPYLFVVYVIKFISLPSSCYCLFFLYYDRLICVSI